MLKSRIITEVLFIMVALLCTPVIAGCFGKSNKARALDLESRLSVAENKIDDLQEGLDAKDKTILMQGALMKLLQVLVGMKDVEQRKDNELMRELMHKNRVLAEQLQVALSNVPTDTGMPLYAHSREIILDLQQDESILDDDVYKDQRDGIKSVKN